MKSIFKVKDAENTVRDVYINGILVRKGDDYVLGTFGIKLNLPLEQGESITYTQKTTIRL